MRKWAWLFIVALAMALTGCSDQPANDSSASAQEAEPAEEQLITIREKLFIAEVNDIYLNADDYMDKTICYEGVFDCYPYTDEGDMFYSVIRYGPGCCGNDGNVGFEVVWDKAYPQQGDWVRVEGTLEYYEEFGEIYLRLRAKKIDVLTERGNEIVSQ